MLLEKINELESANFSFRLYQIGSSAISMHDAYEIIFVLKGKIDLKCTAFNYHLSEGDIFIVNVKELHKFSNGSDDNLLLIFHFTPYLYLHIFPKLDFYLFVCNSFASNKKDSPKLLALQQMLLQLAISMSSKGYSEQKVNDQVLSIITYLINNFQSFYVKKQGYYDNTSLESNDYQLQRICEIQEYIYINYKNKIRLEDLADYLHLSKYYVSHLIKNTIGLSMTDFLSLTRVEQSESLLLSEDMSIEQIAFECGFSARRYYEKHFVKWYGLTPSEYRKTYLDEPQEDYVEFDLSYIQTDPAKTIARQYTHRKSTSSALDTFFNFKFSLDALTEPFPHNWEGVITISNPYSSAFYLPASLIAKSKEDLHYSAVRIKNIFTPDLIEDFHPEQLNGLIDAFVNIHVKILLYVSLPKTQFESFHRSLELFFEHVKGRYSWDTVEQWEVEVEIDSSVHLNDPKLHDTFQKNFDILRQKLPGISFSLVRPTEQSIYYSHNSMLLTPYIVHQCLEDHMETIMLYRELCESNPESKNKSTRPYPSSCLLTTRLERKPLYYIWSMLSCLGNKRLMQQPGIVVTKRKESFYVLLYDPNSAISTKLRTQPITMHLELSNVKKQYLVTESYLDSERCLFQHQSTLGFPSYLPKEVICSMNSATSPAVNFHLIDSKESSLTLSYKLNPYSLILLSFIEMTSPSW